MAFGCILHMSCIHEITVFVQCEYFPFRVGPQKRKSGNYNSLPLYNTQDSSWNYDNTVSVCTTKLACTNYLTYMLSLIHITIADTTYLATPVRDRIAC